MRVLASLGVIGIPQSGIPGAYTAQDFEKTGSPSFDDINHSCNPSNYAGCTASEIQYLITVSPEYLNLKRQLQGDCPNGYTPNPALNDICVDENGHPLPLTPEQEAALIAATRVPASASKTNFPLYIAIGVGILALMRR